MPLLTVIFYSLLQSLLAEASTRIVGGQTVSSRSDFSYQVSLRIQTYHTCGGSLIDARHVLTAAHCVHDPDSEELLSASYFSVAAGNLKLSGDPYVIDKKVENIFVHESYGSRPNFNDLAVLRLSSNYSLSDKIQPILLNPDRVTAGTSCTVSGWGYLQSGDMQVSEVLKYVRVPVVYWNDCNKAYGNTLSTGMVCAGQAGKDSCQGDSGGPMVCNQKLTGIVSFGKGCGLPGYPGVYTEVSPYIPWIQKQLTRSSSFRPAVSTLLLLISVMICLLFDL